MIILWVLSLIVAFYVGWYFGMRDMAREIKKGFHIK
jgi:uncharacterized protein YneF (UPF0154 family)